MNIFIVQGLAALLAGTAAAAPRPADLELAAEAVRHVRLAGLRSPSEFKMVMAGIKPGSPQAALIPGLKKQYDESLSDLVSLRAEFDREFSWGHKPDFGRLAGRMRELTARYRAGNCSEQAFLAQAWLRDRGVKAHLVVFETFDWWTMQLLPDKNHVFAVFSLPEGANPADPSQWGEDAVAADPWGRLAGPARESLAVMLDDIFKLDQSHQKPRYHVLDYENLSKDTELP